jgi:hypothetical protein
VELVQHVFPCQLVHFPCKYLRVPLSVHKLRKVDLQPLVDMVVDRLPMSKSHLMSRVSRTSLTKVMISVIPIHVLIVVKVSPWIIKMVDKLRRAFIWTNFDMVQGGQCIVAWRRVIRLVELGGLGVLDLSTLDYTLRLHWA